ncbi:EGF-like repeat and discoidin I-like domain-containing protein 3 [Branchiostoma lanceolatum]|uniref:EGF-like repeat and discoidin I-like domain-containing protein 3 n=1 Tax=Branchiostoma lanceolatum TaxID=7740 RepID=UPI00345503F5
MGTIIQGRVTNNLEWVTSYKLQYSTDRISWTTYAGSDGSEMVFPGNVNKHIPVTNLLNNSVDARYVRFVIQSWINRIAMRVEIVGCNTTEVPPACPHLLGMESGAIPDDSIIASSIFGPEYDPSLGRLNHVGGTWAAKYNAIGQWLQVDLGEMKRVMGTIIQGRGKDHSQWVTSYKLQYSTDRVIWTTYAGSDGSEMVFPGNVDMSTPVTNLLHNPVDARHVRLVVQSWYGHVVMRVEIVGCNTTAVLPACPNQLGMESGAIPDGSITASSFYGPNDVPYYGRLNRIKDGAWSAWIAKYNIIGQWLQVDLGEMKRVTGTIIQGRVSSIAQWVTSYKLQYSTDRISWTTYTDSDGSEMGFPGNIDMSIPVTNLLNNPVDARYVRFVVQSWVGDIAMRAEIVGCNTSRL